jgi:hypothetical protein
LHDTLAILFRTLDDDGISIRQEVVQFKFLAKSLDGVELARRLLSVLLRDFGVENNMVFNHAHDRYPASPRHIHQWDFLRIRKGPLNIL